jgi:hypothetical protein
MKAEVSREEKPQFVLKLEEHLLEFQILCDRVIAVAKDGERDKGLL